MSENLTEEVQNTSSHDVNVDSSPTTEAEAQPQVEAEADAPKTEEPKKPNNVQQRINQLTREKHEARQKSEDLEKRLAALETKPATEEKAPAAAPKEDSFDDYSDYQAAQSNYVADRAAQAAYDRISSENKARDDASKVNEHTQQMQAKKAAFDKNLDAKRENFADFEDVAYGHTFMDTDLATQIFEMEKGPEVAYHLGSHLDVAEKIFAMTPVQRARELTRLEFTLDTPEAKKVSTAPDPITTLGNSEAVEADPDKMSAEQWRAWRNKQVHG